MKLTFPLLTALLGLTLALPTAARAADTPMKKPNILWLIAEDFGQHLGCFGTKEVWTPNYDMDSDPWELHNLAKSDKPADTEALKRLRGVLEKWIIDTNDQGRRFETLTELQAAEPRFIPARDWRPQPGTKEAAEAEALRAAAKNQSKDGEKTPGEPKQP
jgi:arylsulfatase A-like enzyme